MSSLISKFAVLSGTLLGAAIAFANCGEFDIQTWTKCTQDTECVVDVGMCGFVRGINRSHLADYNKHAQCISTLAGACAPGAKTPRAEQFQAFCKSKVCTTEQKK